MKRRAKFFAPCGAPSNAPALPVACSAAIDHGPKLMGYFSLPSLAHYLILDPERRVAIHHKRGQGDIIETRILSEGVVRLDPPGIEAPVAEMFAPA